MVPPYTRGRVSLSGNVPVRVRGPCRWAMRAPALIRYVAAEPGNLLSPSWDGPKMYFNIEARPRHVHPYCPSNQSCFPNLEMKDIYV
jgi:hypothetical protein